MVGEHAQLSLRRTGGLAGLPMQAKLDTRDLPDDEAHAITEALDRTDLDAIADAESWPAGAADTFRYELSVQRGTNAQTIAFSDRQTPASLTPLIQTLMRHAQVAAREQDPSPAEPNPKA